MVDELRLRTVKLEYPHPSDQSGGFFRSIRRRDRETWLSMLEQLLSTDFKDYVVDVTHDPSNMIAKVSIVFASVEDATLFRLQHSR